MTHSTQETVYKCDQCDSIQLAVTTPQCCDMEMTAVRAESARSPELDGLLREVFGISEIGLQLCLFLAEETNATASEVASAVDIDGSTARRQLNHLVEIGIVERAKKLRSKGGFVYVYTPVPIDEQRKQLKISFYAWVDEALDLIDDIEQEKLEAAAREPAFGDSDSSGIYRK